MMRRVTEKPWFGSKRYIGWGWTPVSWEGWAAIGAFIVLLLFSVIVLQGVVSVIAVTALVGVLLVVCSLTGDPPG